MSVVSTLPATLTSPGSAKASGQLTARLVVVYALDKSLEGQFMLLAAPGLVIGREAGPDTWVINDRELSRKHAQIAPNNGGWELRDCGSHNGCFVLGERRASAQLATNDVIRVGTTLLLFEEVDLLNETPRAAAQAPLIGSSLAMQQLRGQLERAAKHAAPVLVLGKSGVGKELCAREIHNRSLRTGAFVAVNCAALPESLVESELFGHVAGAFTGASNKEGLFAAADRGTLLLDEIAEMALPMQAKLLRALSANEIRPVGSARARPIDVKFVAATLKDLATRTEAKQFRGDLYARLAGQIVQVPSLAQRRSDILEMSRAFLAKHAPSVSFSPRAAEALLSYSWPYNVRELENAMNVAAVTVGERGSLELEDLPEAVRAVVDSADAPQSRATRPPESPSASSRKGRPEASALRELLDEHQGNYTAIARVLGVDRRQIYRWLDHYDIKR